MEMRGEREYISCLYNLTLVFNDLQCRRELTSINYEITV